MAIRSMNGLHRAIRNVRRAALLREPAVLPDGRLLDAFIRRTETSETSYLALSLSRELAMARATLAKMASRCSRPYVSQRTVMQMRRISK